MTLIDTIFVATTTLVLFYALSVAWARRTRWLRWPLVVAALLLIPAAYVSMYDLLSRPKPLSKEYIAYYMQEAEVLYYKSEPGEALYLLLDNDEFWAEPRWFLKAWNDKTQELAGELQRKFAAKGKKGGRIILQLPFDKSLEREKPELRHEIPQFKRMPPKDRPSQPGQLNRNKPKKYSI